MQYIYNRTDYKRFDLERVVLIDRGENIVHGAYVRELHIRKSDGLHSDGFRSFYHTLEFIGGTVRYAAAVIKYCDVCANLFNLLSMLRRVRMSPTSTLRSLCVRCLVGFRLKTRVTVHSSWATRSRLEERRVGKECRSRWSPYH